MFDFKIKQDFASSKEQNTLRLASGDFQFARSWDRSRPVKGAGLCVINAFATDSFLPSTPRLTLVRHSINISVYSRSRVD